MDATALRWVLAIIGIVVLVGVYFFTLYQQKLRRRAAIKTLTQDELESGVIEDTTLRRELSSIRTMLKDEIVEQDLQQIKINPSLDTDNESSYRPEPVKKAKENPVDLKFPETLNAIEAEHLVLLVLKHPDDSVITGSELVNAFKHVGLEINEQGHGEIDQNPMAQFRFINMTLEGSFKNIADPQFYTYGIACFYDVTQVDLALTCYELMLQKIDELVRVLELKVYNHDLELLTLEAVKATRDSLKGYES